MPVWNVQSANGELNEYSHLVTWIWLSDVIQKPREFFFVKNNNPKIFFNRNVTVFEQEQFWKNMIVSNESMIIHVIDLFVLKYSDIWFNFAILLTEMLIWLVLDAILV